jgi:hypothetical protein
MSTTQAEPDGHIEIQTYRQHHGQKEKDKRTTNDLQNITQNIKDRATRSILNAGEHRCSGRVSSFCTTCGTLHVNLFTHTMIMYVCWYKIEQSNFC